MMRVIRYSPYLVILHWLFALLITVALAGGAFVLTAIPNSDPMKIQALRQHFAGGVLLGVLMLIRLIVRMRTTHPDPSSTGRSRIDWFARATHRLFYVLVLAQAGSGIVMALQTRLPSILFGGHGGNLPASFWTFPVRYVHYAISRLLIALIALHAATALYHTFILRDGLLRRMWFGSRTAA